MMSAPMSINSWTEFSVRPLTRGDRTGFRLFVVSDFSYTPWLFDAGTGLTTELGGG